MDNINSPNGSDSRIPLVELYMDNNQPEACNNQNKSVHLFDMESTFLQNSVLSPIDIDSDLNESNTATDVDQENIKPRYSILNTFDPIVSREAEVKSYKSPEKISIPIDDNSQEHNELLAANEEFAKELLEDIVEKVFISSPAANDTLSSTTVLNDTNSVSKVASDSSVLDSTEVLNVTITVQNCSPQPVNLSDNINESSKSIDICNNTYDSSDVLSSTDTDSVVEVNLTKIENRSVGNNDEVKNTSTPAQNTLTATNTENIDDKSFDDSFFNEDIDISVRRENCSLNDNRVDIVNEVLIEEKKKSVDYTYENICSPTKTEEIIGSSALIQEEGHMSATERSSELNDSTVTSRVSLGNLATCTSEMEEIINQNECFEKHSEMSNSSLDKIAECEKYKLQIVDLKKELKSCRQKTVALETEVVDFKLKENELKELLENYKQSTISKEEQLKYLLANEEVLKNELKDLRELNKQQENNLKEMHKKDSSEKDELLKSLQANEEALKNEIKELKAIIKQQETQSQSDIQISRVMEEYEKSMSNLLAENEKMKKERDTAQMHLSNVEMAFSDVHQKYERCKAIVQGYKDNEESFKQDIAMNRETIVIQEQKYETLKAHAMAQLEKSNQELAAMRNKHDTEMARLAAQLKRYEIKNVSLMESLQQKSKECEQLSAVCDEFIGNV